MSVADSLRPSVREMDECSDFCSLRGVEAIDKSSCNMHEYTSSLSVKSGWADELRKGVVVSGRKQNKTK